MNDDRDRPRDRPRSSRLQVAAGDADLDSRLSDELDTYNFAASGVTDQREVTFQAPAFYERHGYVETGRTEGLPVDGAADVHFVKRLVPVKAVQ